MDLKKSPAKLAKFDIFILHGVMADAHQHSSHYSNPSLQYCQHWPWHPTHRFGVRHHPAPAERSLTEKQHMCWKAKIGSPRTPGEKTKTKLVHILVYLYAKEVEYIHIKSVCVCVSLFSCRTLEYHAATWALLNLFLIQVHQNGHLFNALPIISSMLPSGGPSDRFGPRWSVHILKYMPNRL